MKSLVAVPMVSACYLLLSTASHASCMEGKESIEKPLHVYFTNAYFGYDNQKFKTYQNEVVKPNEHYLNIPKKDETCFGVPEFKHNDHIYSMENLKVVCSLIGKDVTTGTSQKIKMPSFLDYSTVIFPKISEKGWDSMTITIVTNDLNHGHLPRTLGSGTTIPVARHLFDEGDHFSLYPMACSENIFIIKQPTVAFAYAKVKGKDITEY